MPIAHSPSRVSREEKQSPSARHKRSSSFSSSIILAMAFVPSSVPVSGSGGSSFSGSSLETTCPARVSAFRMAAEKEPSAFGKQGKSLWKESVFTGGMPGGEAFFISWVEGGMKTDFPDLPQSLQASSEYKPKVAKKTGVIPTLDNIEFFKGFSRDPDPEKADAPETTESPEEEAETATIPEDEAPNDSLYAPYFPAGTRYLAPEINITYEKDFYKDRVSLAMTEVTASPTDVYYPKEMKNKAPIIDISYNGNLATAYVSVKLDDVDGLPTLPPPPKNGEAVTTLSQGSGGGLKLSYAVAGSGPVNI